MSDRGANLRAKNAAMAADMKARGIDRNTARCPICNVVLGWSRNNERFYQHISFHPPKALVREMPRPASQIVYNRKAA